MKYGLIGEKLGHSFSKLIHEELADYTYDIKELSSDQVEAFIKRKEFNAINVTIPYKQVVMPFLDEISTQAQAIGAVNTVVRKGEKLYGYNTDFFGMRALIQRAGIEISGKKVLIAGRGGTSHTARAVAADLGAKEVIVASRSGKDGVTYAAARLEHTDAQIIINTTPCGMYPNVDDAVIDLSDYPAAEGLVDVVYNPLRTKLVMTALERGIPAVGGLYMLVAQAAYAVEFFLDTKVPEVEVERVYNELYTSKENIVLIGMPGCGKSTIGEGLAKQLNRPFVDTDQMITERYGKTPSEIIRKEGEPAFREMESAVIREQVAPMTGSIIATGGGAILRDENVRFLKLNGKTVFLDRSLDLLAVTFDRPLSSDRELLEKRYHERYPRYLKAADLVLSADERPTVLCKKIIKELQK